MKIGTLIRYKGSVFSVHSDVVGCTGIVLSKPNRHGQYKVQVMHKILFLLDSHMEVMDESR